MIVVYRGHGEIIACTKKAEKKVIKDFFTEGGRNLDEYDRDEVGEYFSVEAFLALDHTDKAL